MHQTKLGLQLVVRVPLPPSLLPRSFNYTQQTLLLWKIRSFVLSISDSGHTSGTIDRKRSQRKSKCDAAYLKRATHQQPSGLRTALHTVLRATPQPATQDCCDKSQDGLPGAQDRGQAGSQVGARACRRCMANIGKTWQTQGYTHIFNRQLTHPCYWAWGHAVQTNP